MHFCLLQVSNTISSWLSIVSMSVCLFSCHLSFESCLLSFAHTIVVCCPPQYPHQSLTIDFEYFFPWLFQFVRTSSILICMCTYFWVPFTLLHLTAYTLAFFISLYPLALQHLYVSTFECFKFKNCCWAADGRWRRMSNALFIYTHLSRSLSILLFLLWLLMPCHVEMGQQLNEFSIEVQWSGELHWWLFFFFFFF